ncbi:MAG: hypothetical protein PHC74_10200 [Sulfurimonas sp.]|nr:hypothetical protein [Sulfurimonas sp.]
MKSFILSVFLLLLSGCSGGGTSDTTPQTAATNVGMFVDGPVHGLQYSSKSHSGSTDSSGFFYFTSGEEVTFKVGSITLGKRSITTADSLVTPLNLVTGGNISDYRVVEALRILQTLDEDKTDNVITMPSVITTPETIDLSQSHTPLSDSELASLIHKSTTEVVSEANAKSHFNDTLSNLAEYQAEIDAHTNNQTSNSSDDDNDNDNDNDDDDENDNEDDNDNDDGDTNSGGTTTGGGTTTPTTSGSYTLLAWNDLGMHCFDGSDFSVFSILPPYNNLNAHLINKTGTSNKHVTSGVSLTYQALSYDGHTNTISSTKTNFWDYLGALFPGATSVADVGLTGNQTPSATPQAMKYNATHQWFEADGIPIVNRDDNNATNYYPMVRVVAKDTAGTTLATADVVLPVSDEMDCAKCHGSNVTSNAAKPSAGWENDTNALRDYKYNILKLHDDKHTINANDLAAVQAKGYNYQATLYDTAKAGTPILCASCHSSNALGTTSVGSAKSLTASLHSKHANVLDTNGVELGSSTNRDACYSCHPGAATECLRGAMGSAKDANGNQTMQCQSCHGNMSDVGNSARTGWLDQPNCQVCHENGARHTSALVNGSLRQVVDTKFATNPNTPAPGKSLYRFSTGHGDLQCSSCHGSTHAIFPTSHAADNVYSENLQGHSGTVAECTSCHTTMPSTTTGGPHGMHTVGQSWVSSHENVAENNAAQCTTCHGADYRGSVLSKTFSARTLNADGQTKNYAKGAVVGCYDCHGKEW